MIVIKFAQIWSCISNCKHVKCNWVNQVWHNCINKNNDCVSQAWHTCNLLNSCCCKYLCFDCCCFIYVEQQIVCLFDVRNQTLWQQQWVVLCDCSFEVYDRFPACVVNWDAVRRHIDLQLNVVWATVWCDFEFIVWLLFNLICIWSRHCCIVECFYECINCGLQISLCLKPVVAINQAINSMHTIDFEVFFAIDKNCEWLACNHFAGELKIQNSRLSVDVGSKTFICIERCNDSFFINSCIVNCSRHFCNSVANCSSFVVNSICVFNKIDSLVEPIIILQVNQTVRNLQILRWLIVCIEANEPMNTRVIAFKVKTQVDKLWACNVVSAPLVDNPLVKVKWWQFRAISKSTTVNFYLFACVNVISPMFVSLLCVMANPTRRKWWIFDMLFKFSQFLTAYISII